MHGGDEEDAELSRAVLAHLAPCTPVFAESLPGVTGARLCSRELAERVDPATAQLPCDAQTDEITLMSNWLRDRNQPIPDPSVPTMAMNMNGMQHTMLMPGMLSEEQMKELDAARGPDFDKLFLKYMIQHHQGALQMVNDVQSTNGAGQDEMTFKLTSDVYADQSTEIARMQKMLAQLTFGGSAP